MDDESSNPNLEWKKSGFDVKETITRKTNVKKALEYEATDKKGVNNVFAPTPAQLPKGLKKIRKKIKEVYDEDEEDEDEFIFAPAMDASNSLINALNENEKQQLKQNEILNTIKMQQMAGKVGAIAAADKISRDLGLKKLNKNTIANNMQNVATDTQTLNNTLKDKFDRKIKGKWRNMSEAEMVNWLRGIKKIQSLSAPGESDKAKAKALEGWSFEEIMDAGKTGKKKSDQEKLAEKILEKSGRDKKTAAKTAVKQKSTVRIKGRTLEKSY